MRFFRNERLRPPPWVRSVPRFSTPRVTGTVPFADSSNDSVLGETGETGEKNAPGSLAPAERERMLELTSIPNVIPFDKGMRTRGGRTRRLDHGTDLIGLMDDDHNLYYRHDGRRPLTGSVPIGGTTDNVRDFIYDDNVVVRMVGSTGVAGIQLGGATTVPYMVPYSTGANASMTIAAKGTGKLHLDDVRFIGDLQTYNINQLKFDMYRLTGDTLFKIYNSHGTYKAHLEVEGGITADALALASILPVAGNLIIGNGAAGVDYKITFDGEDSDGVITWMEDEGRFDFDSPILATLTTPTIGDFTNAAHNHEGAAGGGQLDHTAALTNVGTKTHAQIDTHIADTTDPHGVSVTLTTPQIGDFTNAVHDHTNAAGGGSLAAAAHSHAMLDGSVHTDSVADGVTRGSLIYGNATPKWDELVVGAFGQYLRVSGFEPVWSDLSIVDDDTPQLGGELDCNGKDIDDNTRAYVKFDSQLYVNETVGIAAIPISLAALNVNPSGANIRYGIFGGCTYTGSSNAVYGLIFTGIHDKTDPVGSQYAHGSWVTAVNNGVADAGFTMRAYGSFARATNAGVQIGGTTIETYGMVIGESIPGAGAHTGGDFYTCGLFVREPHVPGGVPTSNVEWCALFEGAVQVNSDKPIIFEGTNTVKGDTYLIYDSAGVTLDSFLGGAKKMSIGATSVTITDRLILPEGVQTKYAIDNVADPPTDAQLDTAFGDPTVVGSGFVGVLDDNDAGTDCYICWTTGTAGEWFYVKGTKAV